MDGGMLCFQALRSGIHMESVGIDRQARIVPSESHSRERPVVTCEFSLQFMPLHGYGFVDSMRAVVVLASRKCVREMLPRYRSCTYPFFRHAFLVERMPGNGLYTSLPEPRWQITGGRPNRTRNGNRVLHRDKMHNGKKRAMSCESPRPRCRFRRPDDRMTRENRARDRTRQQKLIRFLHARNAGSYELDSLQNQTRDVGHFEREFSDPGHYSRATGSLFRSATGNASARTNTPGKADSTRRQAADTFCPRAIGWTDRTSFEATRPPSL